MSLIISKIKAIHAALELKQTQVSIQTGIKQEEISRLLAGNKKFLPNEYIAFLQKNKVDLNWLFDDEQPTEPVVFTTTIKETKVDQDWKSEIEKIKLEIEKLKSK